MAAEALQRQGRLGLQRVMGPGTLDGEDHRVDAWKILSEIDPENVRSLAIDMETEWVADSRAKMMAEVRQEAQKNMATDTAFLMVTRGNPVDGHDLGPEDRHFIASQVRLRHKDSFDTAVREVDAAVQSQVADQLVAMGLAKTKDEAQESVDSSRVSQTTEYEIEAAFRSIRNEAE